MASKTKKMRQNEEAAKQEIVRAYRAGKCDADGRPIPKEKWGMAGKGCHFRPPIDRKQYRKEYRKIFGHD